MTFIRRIISGGQTGADQGGLMAAYDRSITTGGWAPAGFRTANGPNPMLELLGLQTTLQEDYAARTLYNVQSADATIIFASNTASPGTKLTRKLCVQEDRPCFLYELSPSVPRQAEMLQDAVSFLLLHRPKVLNVAGNRDLGQSTYHYQETRHCLGLVLDLLADRLREQADDTMEP